MDYDEYENDEYEENISEDNSDNEEFLWNISEIFNNAINSDHREKALKDVIGIFQSYKDGKIWEYQCY